MQLTIIEPHAHFELLIELCPALTQLPYSLRIVCSAYCKKEVLKVYPEMQTLAQWDTSPSPEQPGPGSVLIFTSLQYNRNGWLSWIRQFPSALMIHNANTYLGNPNFQWAKPNETDSPYIKYSLKKHLQFPLKKRRSQAILKHLRYLIPYSSLQIPFIQNHCSVPVYSLPLPVSRPNDLNEGYDFFPLYGKVRQINSAFLQQIQSQLKPAQVCLCRADEKEEVETYLPACQFVFSPVSHSQYMNLFRNASRVILPLQQAASFGVVRERLGETKVLARMTAAIMYNKPLLLPPGISTPPPAKPLADLVSAFESLVSRLSGA